MRVAFRADASRAVGTGHVMRCLTLAEAFRRSGAETRFVCRSLPQHLRSTLRARQHEVIELPAAGTPSDGDGVPHSRWLGTSQRDDARDTTAALAGEVWDWIVVDHYAIDARWETIVRGTAESVAVIDDLADRSHDCDLLLDQNLSAGLDGRYRGNVPAHCRLLLGPRYALLRDEFRTCRARAVPRTGPVRRILVLFGGVDAGNYTGRCVEALSNIAADAVAVDVVIGASHDDRAGIESACAKRGYRVHLQTDQVAELMAAADLALGAGGTALWERACLGVPSVVFAVANNQRVQVEHAAATGLVYAPDVPTGGISAAFIERHTQALLENAGLRHALSRTSMETVDGRGVIRVLRYLRADIDLRVARQEDARMLFEWRNHPSIREVSRTPDAVDWATHERWFAAVLSDRDRILLIGERSGVPLGIVRFDIDSADAEVSIYLAPDWTGRGTGNVLLDAAERWLASARPDVCGCRAHVLGHNQPSHRLFLDAGYHVDSTWYLKQLRQPRRVT